MTRGIRVTVEPSYFAEQSDPSNRKFQFGYRIRIVNESETTAQLLSRKWIIIDAAGRRQEVEGEGVIGQQPILRPSQSHEYSSFCPLDTRWGTMEGHYVFRGPGDERFEVAIKRFFLVAPQA